MTHTPDENSTFTAHLNLEQAPNGAFDDGWETLENDNLALIDAGVLAASRSANIVLENQTAYEDLVPFQVVYYDGTWSLVSGEWGMAAEGSLLGIWLDTTVEEGAGRVQIFGRVTNPAWSLTEGREVWLGNSSNVTETKTIGSYNQRHFSAPLGHTLDATSIWFAPRGVEYHDPPLFQNAGAYDAFEIVAGTPSTVFLADTTLRDVPVTLPSAPLVAGLVFVLKKVAPAATTYSTKFIGQTGETIDGADETPQIAAQYGSVRVVSDGNVWHII